MRSGWSQAKAIIKQQRRTIKQQELQLQLAINGVLPAVLPLQPQPQLGASHLQQQGVDISGSLQAHLQGGSTWNGEAAGDSQYPITSFVLQKQQQSYQQATAAGAAAAGTGPPSAAVQLQTGPGSSASWLAGAPGSLAWAVQHSQCMGSTDSSRLRQ